MVKEEEEEEEEEKRQSFYVRLKEKPLAKNDSAQLVFVSVLCLYFHLYLYMYLANFLCEALREATEW